MGGNGNQVLDLVSVVRAFVRILKEIYEKRVFVPRSGSAKKGNVS